VQLAKRATRGSWKNKPIPKKRVRIEYHDTFTPAERDRIALGLVPREMEDKWFIFLDGASLFFCRSWTGNCLYELTLAKKAGAYVTKAAWANRDISQYKNTDGAYDAALLRFLVRGLLLAQDVRFPSRGDLPRGVSKAIYRHHIIGHGRPSDAGG